MVTGYGLLHQFQIREICHYVCDVLGHGASGNAVTMLMETCAQETNYGTFSDRHPGKLGVGLTQIDLIAFNDIINRVRDEDVTKIKNSFGIDVAKVSHNQLAYSPLLSLIFCRLFYKLIPDTFPETLGGRAQYWKKFYNTDSGRGTVQEFIHNSRKWVPR